MVVLVMLGVMPPLTQPWGHLLSGARWLRTSAVRSHVATDCPERCPGPGGFGRLLSRATLLRTSAARSPVASMKRIRTVSSLGCSSP